MKHLIAIGGLFAVLALQVSAMTLGVRMAVWHLSAIRQDNSDNYTKTTPEPVPYVWLDEAADILVSAHGGDYEAAAFAPAANGVDKVWECYVAGISPTNAAARFEARIEVTNGVPVVTWSPDLNEGGTKRERAYTVEGKANLTDAFWGPTNAASRFFRVKVGMPE